MYVCVEGWWVGGGLLSQHLCCLSLSFSHSLSVCRSFSLSLYLSGYNYANSMYIAVAPEAWGVLKAPRSFSPVTVLGCYWKADGGWEGGPDREIARGGKWDMTTVLSVTTPPIVWTKKRASAASGTIIKEQEWAVHIKQHNGPSRPTCMGTMKGARGGKQRERERGGHKKMGRSRWEKRDTKKDTKRPS